MGLKILRDDGSRLNNMAAFSGVVKEIQSFRHGLEGTFKRHRSPRTVNFDE